MSASGSATSNLSIIEVRGDAVGANSSNEVEVGKAGTYAVEVLFIDSAVGRVDYWWLRWGDPYKPALSLNQDVSLGTSAAGGVEIVG